MTNKVESAEVALSEAHARGEEMRTQTSWMLAQAKLAQGEKGSTYLQQFCDMASAHPVRMCATDTVQHRLVEAQPPGLHEILDEFGDVSGVPTDTRSRPHIRIATDEHFRRANQRDETGDWA